MNIAIARLIALKENMPTIAVPETYVAEYNRILASEQKRTGVDLSQHAIHDNELTRRNNNVWYERSLMALKIDNAIITLQAALPSEAPRSIGF